MISWNLYSQKLDTVRKSVTVIDSVSVKEKIQEQKYNETKLKKWEAEKRIQDSIAKFQTVPATYTPSKSYLDSIERLARIHFDSIVNFVPQVRVFPADTMQRFIARYSKDSLVRLLSSRIHLSKKLMLSLMTHPNLVNENTGAQLLLVGKNFSWGIDSITGLKFRGRMNLYRLYNKQFGPIDVYLEAIKNEVPPQDSIHQFLLKERNNEEMRLLISAFSPRWTVPVKTFDSLVEYSVNFTIPDQLQLLYTLIEYGKAGEEKSNAVNPYIDLLFKRLYTSYNFPSAVKKYDRKKKDNDALITTTPAILLAYGLYAGKVNLEKNGLDIMYLLSFQNEDGSWSNYIGNKQNHFTTTFYALWALEEIKRQLE
jgi:hypothetical protein